jgi:hypothetical protein
MKGAAPFGQGVTRAVAQGTVSHLRGGTFRSGMIGGFFGHMSVGLAAASAKAVGAINSAAVAVRTATAAVIGGTISWASGGKFANGASSAVFTHLFNGEATNLRRQKQINRIKNSMLKTKGLSQAMIKALKGNTFKYVSSIKFKYKGEWYDNGVAWNMDDGQVRITPLAFLGDLTETIFHEAQHSITPGFNHGDVRPSPLTNKFEEKYASDLNKYRRH